MRGSPPRRRPLAPRATTGRGAGRRSTAAVRSGGSRPSSRARAEAIAKRPSSTAWPTGSRSCGERARSTARRRALVGAERLLVVGLASSRRPASGRRGRARGSRRRARRRRRARCRATSSSSAASSRRRRRRARASSEAAAAEHERAEHDQRAPAAAVAARVARRSLPARDVAHAVDEVEQDRLRGPRRAWPSAPRRRPRRSRPRAGRCCRRGTCGRRRARTCRGGRRGPAARASASSTEPPASDAARSGSTATYIGPASRSVMRARSASASPASGPASRRDRRRRCRSAARSRRRRSRRPGPARRARRAARRGATSEPDEHAPVLPTGGVRPTHGPQRQHVGRAARPARRAASSSSRSSSAIRLESAFSASAIGSGRWTQSASGPSGLRPSTRTVWPGLPTTVEFGGTSWTTTALAPIFAPWPIRIGPSSFAPEPIVTLSSTVGWRLPVAKPVPPSVTPW